MSERRYANRLTVRGVRSCSMGVYETLSFAGALSEVRLLVQGETCWAFPAGANATMIAEIVSGRELSRNTRYISFIEAACLRIDLLMHGNVCIILEAINSS